MEKDPVVIVGLAPLAVVTMAAMKEHGLPHDKVNVHGGGEATAMAIELP